MFLPLIDLMQRSAGEGSVGKSQCFYSRRQAADPVGHCSRGGMMKKVLLIVYHSMTGGTAQMAQAAAEGAASEAEVGVWLRRAPEATAQDVLDSDGYIFATPENLAGMSGMMKDFFDRT